MSRQELEEGVVGLVEILRRQVFERRVNLAFLLAEGGAKSRSQWSLPTRSQAPTLAVGNRERRDAAGRRAPRYLKTGRAPCTGIRDCDC